LFPQGGAGAMPGAWCALLLGAVCGLAAPCAALPQTTSLPVFDPAQLVQRLEETNFEAIEFLPPFAGMGRGEVLPNPSGSGGLQARVILLAPVNGWFREGFDTPDLVEAKALPDALR
jgi:hypothetical protein